MINQNWKKELKQLKLEWIKKESPGFFELSGGYDMKVKPYTDQNANGLTTCISDFLKHKGQYANRINSTGLMRKINGEMKWTKGTTNCGTADIFSIIDGQAVSIEIKIGKDRMSDAQHKEKERIEQAGGIYIVAKDFPSFHKWYNETFETCLK